MDYRDGERVCGVSDSYGAGRLCRWPESVKKDITWTIIGNFTEFTHEETVAAFKEAWTYWEEVCDIKARYVSRSSQAYVVIDVGYIDGSSGTLAWSELPCSSSARQLDQKYDSGERWIISATPRNGIDIVRVACHEIGHVIGISHIGPDNLMAATYSSKIRKPRGGDIIEARKRYGGAVLPKPEPAPEPEPEPTPTPEPDGGSSQGFAELLKRLLKILLESLFGKK